MRILVMDDEYLIRNSIVQKLHTMGFEDVLDAANGTEGYQIILDRKPQLIIADIRMPGMDGIDLLKLLRRQHINTLFLILSGYDLFEYAQTAVQEGAFRYLLKPVDWDKFEEAILAAQREIKKQSLIKKERTRLENHFEQSKRILIGRLLSDWVFRRNSNRDAFWNSAEELGLKLPYDSFFMAVFRIESEAGMSSTASSNELLFELETMVRSFLQRNKMEGAAFVVQTELCFLCNFSVKNQSSHSRMTELFHEIEYECRKSIHPHIYAGIGPACTMEKLPDNYQTAHAIVDARISADKASRASTQERSNLAKQTLERCREKLMDSILQNKLPQAQQLLDEVYEPFCFEFICEKKEQNNFCLYIIVLCKEILEKEQMASSAALGDEFELYHQAADLSTPEEKLSWLKKLVGRTIHLLYCQETDKQKTGESSFVVEVERYIQAHFQDRISLKIVAAHFNYTPTYFSSLFKRESGNSFVKYVTTCRYNAAKRLLLETTQSVPAIARSVGCNDYKHFLQTFKKITGVTPTTYREQFQKQ